MRDRNRSLPMIGTATVISPLFLVHSGAPWWALTLLATLANAWALLTAALPQSSHDRLQWWRDRRRHQRLRAAQHAR
ncbi:hypothetical protein [Kitasatospora aureofaciens]|uniref:hypothetical protein n=1 Tax=Kitasatospora aureofaciens TaxID=1894 RepID=UPI0036F46EF3